MNKTIPSLTLPADGELMYTAQAKIHPREIDGRYSRLRLVAVFVLLGLFYLAPWLRWGGHQAVLFDLPARKFYVLGLTFWPQDFFWLAWLLIIAGVSLFFFTALAGRIWCGYACPQTVWTEVFVWIERWCEGRRNQRIKLDAAPWTREKLLRKGAKQFLWITLALWTGFTFVGFFTPVRELGYEVAAASLGGWETFWILFYALATYGNAGFLREQVCQYMCPYARFQSAMFDHDTLIVSYDAQRGEARGARKKSADPKSLGLGDCVDCQACVQVCPTGIDIRDGLQYECIACAACVDACDAVMDKMGYARGLIRYTTENLLGGGTRRIVRLRTVLYATLLAFLVGAFSWGILHRAPLIVELLHDRNALYRQATSGAIENGYTLKLVNKTEHAQRLRIEIENANELSIQGKAEADVAAGEVANLPLTLRADAGMRGSQHIALRVRNADGSIDTQGKGEFFAPEEKHEH